MSNNIVARIDEIGNRLDELEKAVTSVADAAASKGKADK
jgi:hypothetical protein